MAPEFEQLFRRWYCGQLIVLTVGVLLRLLTVNGGFDFPAGGMIMVIWFLNAWWPAIEEARPDWRRLRHVNYYVQTILLFTFLPILVANLIDLLSRYTALDEQGLIAVGMAYLMVAFVPVGVVVTAKIQSLVGRIAILISAVFSGLIGAQSTMFALPILKVPAAFNLVADAGVLGAFGLVLTIGVMMRLWGVRWASWRFNRQAQRGLLAALIVIGVAFSLWNAFSDGSNWGNTFTAWDFHLRSASWKMFLGGLEPGIAEEWLYRYAVLTLLLVAFKRSRFQLDAAVWISGTLFGLWHVTNALAGQAWMATVEQMVFAATLGYFLAVAYLYTGSILVAMGIHAAIDILSMMASGSQTMVVPDAFEWQTIAFTVVVFVALTIFFLTGARRRAIQAQVDQRLLKTLI